MWKTISTGFFAAALLFSSCHKVEEAKDVEIFSEKINPRKDSLAAHSVDSKGANQNKTYKKFSGAWFDIEYPADFKAEPSQKSSTSTEGFDSAFFTSPDGKVQFYIFSPQWSGTPADIKPTKGEKITDQKAQNDNGIFINRWTASANDGSYRRSYEESSELEGQISKIFGIKYTLKEDLEKYKPEYLHFKKSLKQYAD